MVGKPYTRERLVWVRMQRIEWLLNSGCRPPFVFGCDACEIVDVCPVAFDEGCLGG